ncbi:MAG: phosphotransferase family protein [Parvibaculaceae bacterium]|nr:phosphotransferase family protein [Parvibaculaceae bacterium]
MQALLTKACQSQIDQKSEVVSLKRLSGGASQETWSFAIQIGNETSDLILRRAPGGMRDSDKETALPLATEAALIDLADTVAKIRVPPVRFVLTPEDNLGEGFIMDHVLGETIARKILRDVEFEAIRPDLARQCGEILGRLHAIPTSQCPPLRTAPAQEELAQYRATYLAHNHPHPVFELAFKWLSDNAPRNPRITLVHGDFRNGNLMITPEVGVSAVLDWELAHFGDPMEDLGWLCVNSWRFGQIDKPVGGFGQREDLFAAYEKSSGISVDPDHVHYWEILGTLKWGIMCTLMYEAFRNGTDRSVERAAIGRRASETEIDLLRLLAPKNQ